jgi:Tol biopolymer transport system component
MKFSLRILLATGLTLLAAASARAQSLSPTGIAASPGLTRPGDSVTYAITVSNSQATQFGPSPAPGATANFTVVFTHLVTGATFPVGPISVAPTSGFISAAVVDPTTGQTTPGTGTFTITSTLPTRTLEAGAYSARVTLNSTSLGASPLGVGTSSFTVSSSVLTVTGKPDLAITSLSYTAGTSYVGGTIIPMSLTYVNNPATNGIQNVPYTPGINGLPSAVRIQVVLSSNPAFGDADDFQLTINDISATNFGSNPTTDNAGNAAVLADGSTHTFSWNQLLPGNFSGSYYVLAKIDSLNALSQNDPPVLTVNGNNVWGGNALNPSGTLINLLPSNFPTVYTASHANGVANTATGYSDNPSLSSDGRYLAFASDATNLVASDTNAARDIFLFDSQTNLVRRLSVSQQGAQGNAASNNPAISANGRWVAFASDANNLVLGDTNGFSDIYAVDTVTGLISLVSVSTAGAQANNPSFKPAISQTGRYIIFESSATNLVSPATAVGVSHIYLRDRDVTNTGTFDTAGNTAITLMDVTPANLPGNANSIQAAISADGTRVAFASKATNLAAAATTASRQHVYVRNLAAATTTLVSVVNTTAVEGDADSQTPSLSSNGSGVAFASLATNLVAGDTNGVSDIFVYDTTAPGTAPRVVRVSVSSTGAQGTDPSAAGFQLGSINPTISSDGRYVAFASLDSNLTAGDINGQAQTNDANNALDIFVRDRDAGAIGTFDTGGNTATTMVSVNRFGYQTNVLLGVPSTAASNIYPVISANGRFVAFPTDAESTVGLAFGATNLLPLDSNGQRDLFLFDRRTNATVTPATPPTVTITSPGNGGTSFVNTAIPVAASATTTVGVVSSVQFFVNGASLGTSTVFPYSTSWTPTAVGTYTLSALVTDSFGNLGVSANVNVKVNAAPSIGITSPSPGSSFTLGGAQAVSASAAAATPGATIASVQFFANNVTLGTVTALPYSVTWAPQAAGTYTLRAVATDSNGISGSATSQVTVNAVVVPPTVSLTIPSSKLAVAVNGSISLTASAADSDGTVVSVRFSANGVVISTKTTPPYTATFTPTVAGSYSIVAQATDNGGNITDSTPVIVTVLGGIVPDAVYSGTYAAGFEFGRFSVINIGGKAAAFIGYSTTGPAKAYFYQNLVMNVSGGFSAAPSIVGSFTDTGVSGTLDSNRITFIGPIASAVSGTVASGYYVGNIANRAGSTLGAIVGTDGSITAYVSDGSFADAGAGSVDASGSFNLGMAGGTRLVGKTDPTTGFMSGTLVGGPGGTVLAALATGGAFSDGSLRNLSTRGQVGTGDNILIAGFVVGGTTPKQVLVRAIGPTLSSFGITGALTDSQVDIYQGTTRIASNDNWAGDSAIATAANAVGAFPLAASSLDAVVLARLAPGAYTAQVSGTGGKTGVALVELYDVDTVAAFSPQKVINVSTRGVVGTGENILIAGFIVSGSTSKKLLIRGIGPALGTLGVTGALTDPVLQIIRADRGVRTVVRENDNWETGNDSVLVANAAAQVGAFPLASGSKDSVILINLPPGTYNATVSGVGGATGVGLVEVYEVP